MPSRGPEPQGGKGGHVPVPWGLLLLLLLIFCTDQALKWWCGLRVEDGPGKGSQWLQLLFSSGLGLGDLDCVCVSWGHGVNE